jgi:hypothetical protein
MQLKTTLLVPLVALLFGCASPTQQSAPTTRSAPAAAMEVALIDEGVYETLGDTQNIAAPQTAAGKVGEHGGLNLLIATNSLIAKKGTTFGFRFTIKGSYDGPISGFEMHAVHPPMRGVDGKTHTTQTAPIEIDFEKGIAYHDVVYILSEDFEVLPGEWALEIRFQGKSLVSRRFLLRQQ